MKTKLLAYLISKLDEPAQAVPVARIRRKHGQVAVYVMGDFSHYL